VREVTRSPDGTHIASANQDGTEQVWDAASGRRLLTYHGHTRPVWAVAWSPSGACIASATGNTSDKHQRETLQVWNAMTGHLNSSDPVPSTAGEASGTLSVAWSHDGTRLASSGAETIVHLWNAPAFCRR
jgi:WD40 repeat protein